MGAIEVVLFGDSLGGAIETTIAAAGLKDSSALESGGYLVSIISNFSANCSAGHH